jgi:hypothetical protein
MTSFVFDPRSDWMSGNAVHDIQYPPLLYKRITEPIILPSNVCMGGSYTAFSHENYFTVRKNLFERHIFPYDCTNVSLYCNVRNGVMMWGKRPNGTSPAWILQFCAYTDLDSRNTVYLQETPRADSRIVATFIFNEDHIHMIESW